MQLHEFLDQRQADARALVRAACAPSTRWKRSNRRGTSVRRRRRRRCRRPRARRVIPCAQRTVTWPVSVNLKAFDSRLRTIFSHMSRSTCTGAGSGGQSHLERAGRRVPWPSGSCWRGPRCSAARSIGSKVAVHAAGFDAREVEQRVDQLEQAQRVALRERRAARVRRRAGPASAERILQRAEHQRQRRAELVADVREERGLGAVDFRQRRGAAPLVFVGASIGDRGGDLRRRPVRGNSSTARRGGCAG